MVTNPIKRVERRVTRTVINPNFEEKAELLFMELARYLRAAAAAAIIVDVVPSSFSWMIMAPELTDVDPGTEVTPVETDVTTISDPVLVLLLAKDES